MHNTPFFHVVKRNKNLNCKTSNEPLTDTLEVVQFDKLVKVHGQHFERENQMLAENEILNDSHDVLLVFRVVLFQLLENPCLDESLLI